MVLHGVCRVPGTFKGTQRFASWSKSEMQSNTEYTSLCHLSKKLPDIVPGKATMVKVVSRNSSSSSRCQIVWKIVEANEIFPILGKLLQGQLKRANNQALYGFQDGEDLFGSEFFELAPGT